MIKKMNSESHEQITSLRSALLTLGLCFFIASCSHSDPAAKSGSAQPPKSGATASSQTAAEKKKAETEAEIQKLLKEDAKLHSRYRLNGHEKIETFIVEFIKAYREKAGAYRKTKVTAEDQKKNEAALVRLKEMKPEDKKKLSAPERRELESSAFEASHGAELENILSDNDFEQALEIMSDRIVEKVEVDTTFGQNFWVLAYVKMFGWMRSVPILRFFGPSPSIPDQACSDYFKGRAQTISNLVSNADVEEYNDVVGVLLGAYLMVPEDREPISALIDQIHLDMKEEFLRQGSYKPLFLDAINGAVTVWGTVAMLKGLYGLSRTGVKRMGPAWQRMYQKVRGIRPEEIVRLEATAQQEVQMAREALEKTSHELEEFTDQASRGTQGVTGRRRVWELTKTNVRNYAKEFSKFGLGIGAPLYVGLGLHERFRRVKFDPKMLLDEFQRGAILRLEDEVIEYHAAVTRELSSYFIEQEDGTFVLDEKKAAGGGAELNKKLRKRFLESVQFAAQLEHFSRTAAEYNERSVKPDELRKLYDGEDIASETPVSNWKRIQSFFSLGKEARTEQFFSRQPQVADIYRSMVKRVIHHEAERRRIETQGVTGYFGAADYAEKPVNLQSIQVELSETMKILGAFRTRAPSTGNQGDQGANSKETPFSKKVNPTEPTQKPAKAPEKTPEKPTSHAGVDKTAVAR